MTGFQGARGFVEKAETKDDDQQTIFTA